MKLFEQVPQHLALTGRVRNWIKECLDTGKPKYRMPVSCTTFKVEDRFEGESGIIDSWRFMALALKKGAGVAMDLSSLSPNGLIRPSGVSPSGPLSFAEVYSPICHTIRRGGRKIGAINLFLDGNHPDAQEFVRAPRALIPWAKRTLYVDKSPTSYPFWPDIEQAINRGDLWLAKKQYDKYGNRLYSNVCLEVLLKHRGTCLLSHTNLGTVPLMDIPKAMAENMNWLCQVHPMTGVGESGLYLSHLEDRQVGLGWIGLANKLAELQIPYWEFVRDLEQLGIRTNDFKLELLTKAWSTIYGNDTWPEFMALNWSDSQKLAVAIAYGYHVAGKIAASYGMERAFVIAPTATASHAYKDSRGFTTAPEISPPVGRIVDRDSGEFGVQTYYYPDDCETASEVGWETQFELLCLFQKMMNATGLAHSISANIWEDFNKDWADRWWHSPLISTYYRWQIHQDQLDKTDTRACVLGSDPAECVACAE